MPDRFEVYCLGSHWGTFFVSDARDRAKLAKFAADPSRKYTIRPLY